MSARHFIAALALLASACGGPSVGTSSGHLGELGPADDPYPTVRGDRCNLATQNSQGTGILLVAFRDAAVVRVGGEPVRLRFQGDDLHGGGTFVGEGLSIAVGGISPAMAARRPEVGLPAVAAVRQGDSVEDFEATWTCGIAYPAQATA